MIRTLLFCLCAVVLVSPFVHASTLATPPSCTTYVATTGSDTFGNGTADNPWSTVAKAIQASNCQRDNTGVCTLVVCLKPGNYTEQSCQIISSTTEALIILGDGSSSRSSSGSSVWSEENVFLDSFVIQPPMSSSQNFRLTLLSLSIHSLNITSDVNSYFPELELMDLLFLDTTKLPGKWITLTAQHIKITNCKVTGDLSNGIYISTTPNLNTTSMNTTNATSGTLVIEGLQWNRVTSERGIFLQSVQMVNITNSYFTDSHGPIVTSGEGFSLNVWLSNFTASNNNWNFQNGSLLSFPPTTNITLSNTHFDCNNATLSIYPPPISSVSSITIFGALSTQCPISCPTPGTSLTHSVFACSPCPPGSHSLSNYTCDACPPSWQVTNNLCTQCPANTYSPDNRGCKKCPIFSTQPKTAMDHCVCFTGVVVSDDNLSVCNDHFWGIIVASVYAFVFVFIILFWRNKRSNPGLYEQIEE